MKLKTFRKWLRRESEKIPPETYVVTHKLFKPRIMEATDDEKPDFTKTDGTGKEVGYRYVNGYQLAHVVNHYRRMKRGFAKQGFEFVNNYFNKHGLKQQVNGESNETSSTEVRPEQGLSVEA